MPTVHLRLQPRQQQLHLLPEGSELRGLQGTVTLLNMPGQGWPLRVLPVGQAVHFAQPTWVTLRADAAATVAITCHPTPQATPEESRQALQGRWRLGRLLDLGLRGIRRGPRAA